MGVDQLDLLVLRHRERDRLRGGEKCPLAAERPRRREPPQEPRRALEPGCDRDEEILLRHRVESGHVHQLPRYVVIENGAMSSGTW